MIDKNITKENVLKAISEIDINGIPSNRKSTKYHLIFNDKFYPPKYVLSIANKHVNGKELEPNEFGGGDETNNFLINLGFKIQDGHDLKNTKKIETKTNDFAEIHLTAIIKNSGYYSNKSRYELLTNIVNRIDENVSSLILPAGFLKFDEFDDIDLQIVEKKVTEILKNINKNIAVCFGIDVDEGIHQFGIAISTNGILGFGRKFFPTAGEKDEILIAKSTSEKEFGFERTFKWNEKKYFLAVCYDSFGIKHKKLPINNVDYVINLIHGFSPKGEGNSGEVYFAKHGIAGASKQWKCPTFASAVFFDREIPENWQSGIVWNKGEISTQLWKYADNPLIPFKIDCVEVDNEKSILRYFKVDNELIENC